MTAVDFFAEDPTRNPSINKDDKIKSVYQTSYSIKYKE